MNYEKIYNCLIARARLRDDLKGYTEKHHVVPKCIGGSSSTENLAILTAREHYVAHLLLIFVYKDKKGYGKLLWAINKMAQKNRFVKRDFRYNSRLYELLKGRFVHDCETKRRIAASHMGKRLSDETKEKISKTRKERIRSGLIKRPAGNLNGMYGKRLSGEARKRFPIVTLAGLTARRQEIKNLSTPVAKFT